MEHSELENELFEELPSSWTPDYVVAAVSVPSALSTPSRPSAPSPPSPPSAPSASPARLAPLNELSSSAQYLPYSPDTPRASGASPRVVSSWSSSPSQHPKRVNSAPTTPHIQQSWNPSLSTSTASANIRKKPVDAFAELRRMELKNTITEKRSSEAQRRSAAFHHYMLYGGVIKEGLLTKSTQGASYLNWKDRWFVLKHDCLAYYESDSSTSPIDVLLFDASWVVELLSNAEFSIVTVSRGLRFRARTQHQAREWFDSVNHSLKQSGACDLFAFGACFPARSDCSAKPLIDGANTFAEISLTIQSAQSEVLIAGWWISPEVSLVEKDNVRGEALLTVLMSAAKRGVRIHILVYREISVALPNNSAHVEESLGRLHENIYVMRYPPTSPDTLFWSCHEKLVVVDRKIAFVGGLDLCFSRWDTYLHELYPMDSTTLFPGIDYRNPRFKDITTADTLTPDRDIIDRTCVHRMPWHDVHSAVCGPVVRDIGRHFIQRWNHARRVLLQKTLPCLLTMEPDISFPSAICTDAFEFACRCQLLRSVCRWSAGTNSEQSIEEAYLQLILNAKCCIYIENQFFVSSMTGVESFDSSTPPMMTPRERSNMRSQNRVAHALLTRVSRAMDERELFRVVIVLPTMPDMEGTLVSNSTLRAVIHFEYSCIRWLLQNLETCAARNGVAVEEYISFHSLFQTGCVPGTGIVMEEIYVHSKLMIIDDRYAVVGSANINDRSMAGTRDSEIALLIDSVESPAPFARTLRQALWAEHLGREIPSNPVESLELDILSDEGYHASWKRTSSVNTHIMIELFEHFPHGGTQTIEQYTQILKSKEEQKEPQELADEQIKSERMTQLCAGILGHVVDFPVQFLRESDLSPALMSVEGLLPMGVFT